MGNDRAVTGTATPMLPFDRARVTVEAADRRLDGNLASCRITESAVKYSLDSMSLVLDREENGNGCRVTLCNDGPADLMLKRVRLEWPFEQFAPRLDARDYVQLYHSRDFERLSGVRPVHRPNEWSDRDAASSMVTVLSRRDGGGALLIGALPPYGDCFVDLPLLHEHPHRDGSFGIGVELIAPKRLPAGRQDTLASLIVLEGPDGTELLEQYASLIRSRLAGHMRPQPRVTGWNSWDYYAGAVQSSDVLDNAGAARSLFGDALRYMVVDEGYECQWGVWESGWKFPEGLAEFCRQIRQAGYEPGIWTAPLMVSIYTPLYREHPDWFVGDAAGNPYMKSLSYGVMAQLDITHPEAAAHIGEQFRRLRSYGFTYFKCDFAQMLQGASTFASDGLSPAGMLRRLFETIREAIGSDAYLLSCGTPYESAIGIADAHRTTGDVHNFWSNIRQNIRTMFARWWMQGAVGNTDPDFAIVRCAETTADTALNRRLTRNPWSAGGNWCAGREMNLEEAKTLLLACLATGGDLMLSDALGKLNDIGLAHLRTVLAKPVDAARVVNLFERDGDELPIVAAASGEVTLLALFNLSDDTRVQTIPAPYLSQAGVWTAFWSGEPDPPAASGEVVLSPRSARAWWIGR